MRSLEKVSAFILVTIAVAAYYFHFRSVPSGFYTDAASNTLNGLCLAKTGADEYGNFWPVAIRAFDDWRPPLLVYLFALVNLFRPVDIVGARLVSMTLGLIGCAAMVGYLRFSTTLPRPKIASVFPAFFILTLLSSWVLVVHRMPVEFVLVLVTVTPMFALTWTLIQRPSNWKLGSLVGLLIGLMPYAYYGTKPFFATQLALLAWFSYDRRQTWAAHLKKRGVFIAAIVAIVVALPMILDILGVSNTTTRFNSVGNKKPLQWFVGFAQHLDLRMFFFTGDANLRHHTQFLGVLNLAFLPFYLNGLINAFRKKKPYWNYVLAFFFIAFIPASLTNEAIPHSLRTLCCLPALLTLCYLGYCESEKWLWQRVGTQSAKMILAGWLVLGLSLAGANWKVFQFAVPMHDKTWWTLIPPVELTAEKISVGDHSIKSINERLERALKGDLSYCGGYR